MESVTIEILRNGAYSFFIPGVGDVCPASSKEIVYVKRRCPGTTIISKIRAVRAWTLLPQNTAKGFKQISVSVNYAQDALKFEIEERGRTTQMLLPSGGKTPSDVSACK